MNHERYGSNDNLTDGPQQLTFRDWKAMPTHWPLPLKAGPPELPELMAESVWMPNSSAVPCTYDVTSILETTPLVTDRVSPPMGYLYVDHSVMQSLSLEPEVFAVVSILGVSSVHMCSAALLHAGTAVYGDLAAWVLDTMSEHEAWKTPAFCRHLGLDRHGLRAGYSSCLISPAMIEDADRHE